MWKGGTAPPNAGAPGLVPKASKLGKADRGGAGPGEGAGVTHSWSPGPQETPTLHDQYPPSPPRAPRNVPSSPGKAAKAGPGAGPAKGSPPMSARRSVLAFWVGWGGRWVAWRGWGWHHKVRGWNSPWIPQKVPRSHLWQCPHVPMEELGGRGLRCVALGGFHLFWCHIPAKGGQNTD